MKTLAQAPLRPLEGRFDRAAVDALWNRYWREPSDQHRNLLVESYQGLVESAVRRFAARLPRSVDRGDLGTAGSVGLMSAIASFDPTRRVTFDTYAEGRIRGALLDELRTEDWLPRPWRHRLEQQKRAVLRLRAELGREPFDEEVAEHLELTLDEYEQFFGVGLPGTPVVSRNPREAGNDPGSSLEVLEDLRGDQPGERLTRDELLRLVAKRLNQHEYQIVYLKYWEELSMREIGELTGHSESRICKIHSRLIERLKDRFRVHEDAV